MTDKLIENYFVFENMLAIFAIHIDKHGKCKFVLASESGKFNEEGTGGHFPASYHNDMGVGLLLISSSRYSRTCLLNGLRCHAFRIFLEYRPLLLWHRAGGIKLQHYDLHFKFSQR